MAHDLYLSVVIPAFNEAERIERSLREIVAYLDRQPFRSEVIVVDDGSRDATASCVRALARVSAGDRTRIRLLRNARNRGKGYSVRRGFLSARGEIVLFTDADLSAPITEAECLLRLIEEDGVEVAFGSRALDPRFLLKPPSRRRQWAGRLFNRLVRLLLGLPFRDTQCGFKAYRRAPLLPIFRRQRLRGFGFDVEILYLAWKCGLRLRETPVLWAHAEGTKVRLLRDAWRMGWDLIRIRVNDWLGRYRDLMARAETTPRAQPSIRRANEEVLSEPSRGSPG